MRKELTKTLFREITIDNNSIDESARTAELSFSSETGVDRWGELEYLSHDAESIDLSRLSEIGVLLFNHDTDEVIGKINKVWLDESERKCRAVVEFDEDDDSEKYWQKVLSGTLRGVSVGYMVQNWEVVQAGSTSQNGRFAGPCCVATLWQPLEVSIVPVPADASVGVGRSLKLEGDEKMKKEDEATKKEEVRSEPVSPVTPEAPKVNTSEEIRAALSAERSRVAEIRAMGERFEVNVDEYITDGKSVNEVRKVIMEGLPKKGVAVSVEVGKEETEKFRDAARDAMRMRGGMNVKAPVSGAEELRSFKLERLAEECLIRSGEKISGNRIDMIGRALTTTDLPIILTDTAKKSLLEGWDAQPETYTLWCDDTGSTTDFKEQKGVRAGEVDDLELVPESGEYKNETLAETSEKWHIATYGRMFTISRQAIIDDDLGVLTTKPAEMGEAARRKIGDIAYEAFLGNPLMGDNNALFCAAHSNVQTAVAFSFNDFEATVNAIGVMEKAMNSQKDLSKKRRLNIQSKFLLVPTALKLAAARFLLQTQTPLSIDTAANKASGSAANPYAGNLVLVPEARMDDVSETAWYLAAARNTIKIFYLDGNKQPYLESQDGWKIDGIQYKVRIDAGAKAMDWRGLQKNAGK